MSKNKTPDDLGQKNATQNQDVHHGITPKSWYSEVTVVTGTIGSGKSSFVTALKNRGIFTISADDLAREVVAPGTIGLQKIAAEFGKDILNADGTLDRKKLRHLIFSDDAKRKTLESITHPLIRELAETRFKDAIARGVSPLIYEVPLLFEAGLDKAGFKKIVVITVDDETCIRRIMKRSGLSEAAARANLAAQWPAKDKKSKADIVVDNSGSLADLQQQAEKLIPLL